MSDEAEITAAREMLARLRYKLETELRHTPGVGQLVVLVELAAAAFDGRAEALSALRATEAAAERWQERCDVLAARLNLAQAQIAKRPAEPQADYVSPLLVEQALAVLRERRANGHTDSCACVACRGARALLGEAGQLDRAEPAHRQHHAPECDIARAAMEDRAALE